VSRGCDVGSRQQAHKECSTRTRSKQEGDYEHNTSNGRAQHNAEKCSLEDMASDVQPLNVFISDLFRDRPDEAAISSRAVRQCKVLAARNMAMLYIEMGFFRCVLRGRHDDLPEHPWTLQKWYFEIDAHDLRI
jgi:hypothetical protein